MVTWYACEYAKIRIAIQQRWIQIIKYGKQVYNFNDYKRKSTVYSNLNLNNFELSIHCITVKQICTELKNHLGRQISGMKPVQTNCWGPLWLFKLRYVRDNYLIQFNLKFMYNILRTPVNLFKWELKETTCYYCNQTGTIIIKKLMRKDLSILEYY